MKYENLKPKLPVLEVSTILIKLIVEVDGEANSEQA